MAKKKKRKFGDRADGMRIREVDPMHIFMPYLLPNRADNEAVVNTTLDLTAVDQYLEEKNKEHPELKYTLFHVLCGALAKVIILRPKMNRFYIGSHLYQRNETVFAFTVKRHFSDDSDETLALIKMDTDSDIPPVQQFHDKLRDILFSVRTHDENDGATDAMGILQHLPRFLLKFVMFILRCLDNNGLLPESLLRIDPYHSTVFISNVGSIKLDANYHHLTNWGTNSLFVTVSEKKFTPFFQKDGSFEMRDSVDLGLTIDERIADGYYYSGSIRLLKYLLANPSLLDLPITTPVDMEDIRKNECKDSVAG